jgi:hypothetical protein
MTSHSFPTRRSSDLDQLHEYQRVSQPQLRRDTVHDHVPGHERVQRRHVHER